MGKDLFEQYPAVLDKVSKATINQIAHMFPRPELKCGSQTNGS